MATTPTTLSLALTLALLPLAKAGGIVNSQVFTQQNFDYLIVGGGTAGLTVASRLSENRRYTVGVIEAGQHFPDDPLIFTPAFFGWAQMNPTYDWVMSTNAQEDVNGRVFAQPRGKMLGGSSGLNYMAYDRASKIEYDAWSKFGGSSWNWNGLLPYFKKAEKVQPPTASTPFGDPSTVNAACGTSGPVQVSYNEFYSNITGPYLKSVNNLGIPTITTPDDGTNIGVYNCPVSVNRTSGRRSYAANTYHSLAAPRPNYFVLLGAEATKINFSNNCYSRRQDDAATTDDSTTEDSATTDPTFDPTAEDTSSSSSAKSASAQTSSARPACKATASSVTFTANGQSYTVRVGREVIVSAGSLKTPQLLELSGIGAKSRLQSLNIPVVSDLPGVGENLQDHLFVPSSFELKDGYQTFDRAFNDLVWAAQQNATYYATGKGYYASTHSAFAFFPFQSYIPSGTVSSLITQAKREAQEEGHNGIEQDGLDSLSTMVNQQVGQMEIIMFPGHFSPSPAVPGKSYISLLMALQHPWSRGSVHISSKNPAVPPVIDPNYMKNSIDLTATVKAVQFARKIAQTQPLASAIAKFQDPAPSVTTDAQFTDYVKTAFESVYHPIGTASMGPQSDGGVVNSRLVVYGTTNLRVVDASIFPLHLATHIQQTVYAVGEKAADMILADCS